MGEGFSGFTNAEDLFAQMFGGSQQYNHVLKLKNHTSYSHTAGGMGGGGMGGFGDLFGQRQSRSSPQRGTDTQVVLSLGTTLLRAFSSSTIAVSLINSALWDRFSRQFTYLF